MLGSEVPCMYLVNDLPSEEETLKRSFWVCVPCEAYVGTHKRNAQYGLDGTEPLGPLANRKLRRKRLNLHNMMDPVWKKLKWSRKRLYKWLADRLGISTETCHIAMLTDEQCDRAATLLEEVANFAQQNVAAHKESPNRGKKAKKK